MGVKSTNFIRPSLDDPHLLKHSRFVFCLVVRPKGDSKFGVVRNQRGNFVSSLPAPFFMSKKFWVFWTRKRRTGTKSFGRGRVCVGDCRVHHRQRRVPSPTRSVVGLRMWLCDTRGRPTDRTTLRGHELPQWNERGDIEKRRSEESRRKQQKEDPSGVYTIRSIPV